MNEKQVFSVRLDSETREKIMQVAKVYEGNKSMAIRHIVNEYERYNKLARAIRIPPPEAPTATP